MTEDGTGVVLEPLPRSPWRAWAIYLSGHRDDGIPDLKEVVFAPDERVALALRGQLAALNEGRFTVVEIEVDDDGVERSSGDIVYVMISSVDGLWRIRHAAFDRRAFAHLERIIPTHVQETRCRIYEENDNEPAGI